MKTTKITFASILVASAVMSCARMETNSDHSSESQEPEMVPVTITVSRENVKDVDSKVYITETGSFKWKNGDKISLFAGGLNNEMTNSTEDGVTAEFGGTVPAQSDFPQYALYPYQEAAALNGGSITATLPKVQTVVEAGGFYQCPEALLSVGKLENSGSELYLKNVFSLVMITVPASTSFNSITLLSNNGEPLSGTVTVNPETAECSVVSGDPVVTIKPANGTLAAGEYMVAVLPKTLEGGIKVIVVADAVKQRNNTGTITFARNEGLRMPDALLSALKDYPANLTCASELIAWANIADIFPKSTTITLENDIALTPEEAAQYVEANDFKGTFNGNNHAISGLKTPLFGNLRGAVVKDLEIEANIVSNGKKESPFIGTNYGVGILAHYAYADQGQAEPSISGVTTRGTLKVSGVSAGHAFNVGGVVGASNGVPISSCTNYAKVTVENSTLTGGSTSRIVVGGIVGVVQTNTNANLTNCTNAAGADIKVTSTCTSAGSVPVAGIAAYIAKAVTVDRCVNNATVTNEAAAGSNSLTAGIAAFIDAAVKVQKCLNNENATILCASTSAAEQAQHTGGIVAYYNKEANITDCKNYANVKLASAKNANCMTAGIAAYTYTKTTITECENYGTIEDASTYATAKTHNVSGIANLYGCPPAEGKSNLNISGCKNFGDVLNNATAVGSSLVSGIIANAPTYIVIDACENGSATVTPKIVSKNNSSYCYMGGILGQAARCITVTNSKNYGTVINSGVVSSSYRSGGIVGNSVQGDPAGGITQQSVYTSCENYGAIVNDSNTVKEVRLGGIIGSSSTQKVFVTLCKNFGDVYDTEKATSAPTDLCFGGISGYTGNAGSQFEGCISKATITQRSTSTLKKCGEIIGWFNSSSAWTLKDNRIAGTVNGAAVTEANCKSAGFLFGTKGATDANTTGLATNGYYTE